MWDSGKIYEQKFRSQYLSFHRQSSTGQPTTVEAQNAKITYVDGSSFNWDGTLTYTYEKSGSRHCMGKTMKVTGALTGITNEIIFKRGCFGKHSFVPVSGTVEVTTAGVTSVVDYGDGSCDKKFTVTTASVLTEHIFN